MGTKTKLNCNIVKDLLPLYCDGQASSESIEVVEEHVNQCESCKKVYEEMSGELDGVQKIEQEREINALKKVKTTFKIKSFLAILVGVALGVALFMFLFIGVIPVNSEDVDITYDAYIDKMEVNGSKENVYYVQFYVTLKNGKALNYRGKNKRENVMAYKLYSTLKLPFDDRGEKKNEVELGYTSDVPFKDGEQFIFQFKDKTVKYSMKEIAKEAGIQ